MVPNRWIMILSKWIFLTELATFESLGEIRNAPFRKTAH
jgi:hypothetical protein